MTTSQGNGKVMRIGLVLTAVIIIVRIMLELAGAPGWINNIFGVAWLYFIFPVLFALSVAKGGETGRFKALLKDVFLFALYTRLMVMVSYMAAYRFQWPAPRFSTGMGGNVGPDVDPLSGLLWIPGRNALIWVISATLLGMIVGGITLLAKRRAAAA
jgi:hypothetical protein